MEDSTHQIAAPNEMPALDAPESSTVRRVFILGAGFSKAVSPTMPTADELGCKVLDALQERGETLPTQLTRGCFEDWLSRLAENQPDLWEEENHHNRGYFSRISRTIGEILDASEKQAISDDAWLTTWLDRFVAVLHAWQSTVITFNYDNLIERAVNSHNLLDFSNENQRVVSSDLIGQVPVPPDAVVGGPLSTFRLLKLHGSVDWWWSPGDPPHRPPVTRR